MTMEMGGLGSLDEECVICFFGDFLVNVLKMGGLGSLDEEFVIYSLKNRLDCQCETTKNKRD